MCAAVATAATTAIAVAAKIEAVLDLSEAHFIYDPFLMMLCLPISIFNPIITAANC